MSDEGNNNAGNAGSAAPKKRRQQRRRRSKAAKGTNIWRSVPELPAPTPIRPAADPTAVLHSLGDPPLQGQRAVAEHYMAAVIERAASLATALAATAGLLDTGDDY